jgi:hypothetical protein
MSRLRRFCVVSILTFIFALSALAGDIECGVVSLPTQQPLVTGEMATGATTNEMSSAETTYVDPVTEIALNLLQSVLALF